MGTQTMGTKVTMLHTENMWKGRRSNWEATPACEISRYLEDAVQYVQRVEYVLGIACFLRVHVLSDEMLKAYDVRPIRQLY